MIEPAGSLFTHQAGRSKNLSVIEAAATGERAVFVTSTFALASVLSDTQVWNRGNKKSARGHSYKKISASHVGDPRKVGRLQEN